MSRVVSRQMRWQIKQKLNSKCVTCGKKALSANHCSYHLVKSRIYNREYKRVNYHNLPAKKRGKRGSVPCDKPVLLRYKKSVGQ